MAIIDLDDGLEVLTDPDTDLKREKIVRDILESQQNLVPNALLNLIRTGMPQAVPPTGVYDGPIFGTGCCGCDPRK